MPKRIVVSVVAVVALFTAGTGIADAGTLTVEALSNRANLIAGGDALVAVKLPRSINPASVTVDLGSSDITNAFALRPNGRYEGLVTGLQVGSNVLTAQAPGATTATLGLTESAAQGGAWIMNPGTSAAHIMTPGH